VRKTRGNVILKLDMVKADDRLEWDWIFAVLARFHSQLYPSDVYGVLVLYTNEWSGSWFLSILTGFEARRPSGDIPIYFSRRGSEPGPVSTLSGGPLDECSEEQGELET
jgi:hypothetical protein